MKKIFFALMISLVTIPNSFANIFTVAINNPEKTTISKIDVKGNVKNQVTLDNTQFYSVFQGLFIHNNLIYTCVFRQETQTSWFLYLQIYDMNLDLISEDRIGEASNKSIALSKDGVIINLFTVPTIARDVFYLNNQTHVNSFNIDTKQQGVILMPKIDYLSTKSILSITIEDIH